MSGLRKAAWWQTPRAFSHVPQPLPAGASHARRLATVAMTLLAAAGFTSVAEGAVHWPMTRRVPAQSADAVTGIWSQDTLTVFELTHDGKGSVSGAVIFRDGRSYTRRAAIRKGLFNPATGALVLEGMAALP